jgi:hypothetical protein
MIYNISLLFIKLMFFFQYFRIVRQNAKLRTIFSVVMGLVFAWTLSQILTNAFSCIPIQAVWDHTVPGNCGTMSPPTRMLMNSIGNIITDVIILLLPIPVVLGLKLRKAQKLTLIGIFCLGFL